MYATKHEFSSLIKPYLLNGVTYLSTYSHFVRSTIDTSIIDIDDIL